MQARRARRATPYLLGRWRSGLRVAWVALWHLFKVQTTGGAGTGGLRSAATTGYIVATLQVGKSRAGSPAFASGSRLRPEASGFAQGELRRDKPGRQDGAARPASIGADFHFFAPLRADIFWRGEELESLMKNAPERTRTHQNQARFQREHPGRYGKNVKRKAPWALDVGRGPSIVSAVPGALCGLERMGPIGRIKEACDCALAQAPSTKFGCAPIWRKNAGNRSWETIGRGMECVRRGRFPGRIAESGGAVRRGELGRGN
jgi:hypothetical protein